MTLTFDLPPCPDSLLRPLDPRWKLAGLVLATAAVAALETLPALGLAVVGAGLLAVLARMPWRWYLRQIGAVAIFLVLFLLPLPFLLDNPPTVSLGPLTISLYGIRVALLVASKALGVLTLMMVLLVASPLDATLKAAHALHVPGVLVQLVVLTYRYIFVLAGEFARIRTALRVRGYRNRPDRHSYRTIGHVAGTLLVRGYERAERVGQAMACRGFTGRFHSLTEFRTTVVDVLAFLTVVGVAAGLLAWDIASR